MAQSAFTAEELDVLHVFNNDFRFDMPSYQRPYAWTENETAELLQDLKGALPNEGNKGGISPSDEGDGSPYFLGSVVLVNKSGKSYEVVDGQQRLTTLTILFCVLRDLSESDEDRNELHGYVSEKSGRISGTEERFRLSVRNQDNDFFQGNVQKMGRVKDFVESSPKNLSDAKKSILENTKYLWRKLSIDSEDSRLKLSQLIVRRCYFVVIKASDRDSAHRIFSVLNARGLDLLPTDILKSEIIGQVPKANESKYTEKWETIEEDLGRDSFRDLFGHIHMIHVKRKPQEKEFDRSFIKDVLQGAPKPTNGEAFIDKVLEPYADVYQTVSNSAYDGEECAEEINRHLQNLNRVTNMVSFWIAPAMEFYETYRDDGRKLHGLIRDLERLTYGLLFLPGNRDSRRTRYEKVLDDLHKGTILEDTSALQLTNSEKRRIVDELNAPLQGRMRKPLLLFVDSLLADSGASYEHKIITVEHVLPQTIEEGSEWIANFQNEEQRAEWTNKVANLVLLSRGKNSSASNYDFERKKSAYFQKKGTTTFALTTQVINESKWTPKVLERRQKHLIDALKKEWRLD